MARYDAAYEELPHLIKDNLSPQQWLEARRDVIDEGEAIPETARYVDVKNGQIHQPRPARRPAVRCCRCTTSLAAAVRTIRSSTPRRPTQARTAEPGRRSGTVHAAQTRAAAASSATRNSRVSAAA
ncbi:MAG TPA: hypothetical protein VFD32_00500 [Dehalococcoidia bacterium]|nr:hypothetical protein [Dehalococcoidia bacterium]